MLKKVLAIMIVLIFAWFQASAETRVALVIGNSDYKHIPFLPNTERDAKDMSDILSRLGFHVLSYTNLDRDSLKAVIVDFGKKLDNYETGLFYYAGHAIEVSGNNYFIPVDASVSNLREVKEQSVQISGLTWIMKLTKCKTKIIILDACRNNPFESSGADLKSGLALMDAPEGSIVCFSTSPGKTASDGFDQNGLYTEGILKNIMIPDLPIVEMFHNVRNYVIQKSNKKQIPWESTSLTEKFVFNVSPENDLKVNVIEGTEVNFKGEGSLHAQSNINDVSFQWYRGDEHIVDNSSVLIRKSGTYYVKAISPQGQTAESERINVIVSSLVEPQVFIDADPKVNFQGYGTLQALTNTPGYFTWYRDGNKVAEGFKYNVSVSGQHNVELVTSDNKKVKSDFVKVKVNKPAIRIANHGHELYQIHKKQLDNFLTQIYDCDFTENEKVDDVYSTFNSQERKPVFIFMTDALVAPEFSSGNEIKLIIPLYSQYFSVFSKYGSKDLKNILVKESDREYFNLLRGMIKEDTKIDFVSDVNFQTSLENNTSAHLFFKSSTRETELIEFGSANSLTASTDIYSSEGANFLKGGLLALNTFFASLESERHETTYNNLVQQFFALRENDKYFGFAETFPDILSLAEIKIHMALLKKLNKKIPVSVQ